MKRLDIKYSDRALLPMSLTAGDSVYEDYSLVDGKVVRLRYIMGCINKDGQYNEMLDSLSKELYGISFSRVKSIWASRMRGVPLTNWYLVEMKNPDEVREESGAKASRKRR